ncbi:MAG: ATP-binding protein [Sphaerochaeta sp.]|nr:ATP-binding protein [Sphaerochaeta sp.]
MKTKLVITLIEAHNSGSEDAFRSAVHALSDDEDKKRNSTTASLLRQAYVYNVRRSMAHDDSPMATVSYMSPDVGVVPKDKDSVLALLEVLNPKTTLQDVALPLKTMNVLKQIIEEQKSQEKLIERGIAPSNRLLFCGPPGCGKTLTATALAGELGLPMAYVRLDGLISSFLGQTGANIRKVFDFAKPQRIMLFLDEFDAIAKKRDDSNELGELKRVVTTLLQNMDAMPSNVLLVAATNHHHLLDPAIWRRFNATILLESPTYEQRQQIVEHFCAEKLPEYRVDTKTATVLSEGMSGADVYEFMQTLAKSCVMEANHGEVGQKKIAEAWLTQNTLLMSGSGDDYMKALYELNIQGVPLRTLEEISGIPRSTLDYRFKKERTQ